MLLPCPWRWRCTFKNRIPNLLFIESLRTKLSSTLPGAAAHRPMAHRGRELTPSIPTGAKKAGVLALLYPKNITWHVVLIERPPYKEKERHGGQISFPGGAFQATDIGPDATALRETQEEIGVEAEKITLLGKLSEIYIPVSNFLVHPFVGFCDQTPNFVPEPKEVASIIEVPLESLHRSKSFASIRFNEHFTQDEVPCFKAQEKIIWGATAMILNELLEVIKQHHGQ